MISMPTRSFMLRSALRRSQGSITKGSCEFHTKLDCEVLTAIYCTAFPSAILPVERSMSFGSILESVGGINASYFEESFVLSEVSLSSDSQLSEVSALVPLMPKAARS